jgi:hypothetical protein
MMNTTDPFFEARQLLLREGECYFFLWDCMKYWKYLPNDENRGMIRNYVNSHLVNKGYTALTKDNIDDRIQAAVAVWNYACSVAHKTPTRFQRLPYLLVQWMRAWDCLSESLDEETDFPGFMFKKASNVVESIRNAKLGLPLEVCYSDHPEALQNISRESWRWWCALYAMHGKEMFFGKGYT